MEGALPFYEGSGGWKADRINLSATAVSNKVEAVHQTIWIREIEVDQVLILGAIAGIHTNSIHFNSLVFRSKKKSLLHLRSQFQNGIDTLENLQLPTPLWTDWQSMPIDLI